MKKRSYGRSAAWATRSTHSRFSDVLTFSRWRLAALYFGFGTFIFLVVGLVVDSFTSGTIHDIALLETGEPVQRAFQLVQAQLWIGRAIMFVLFALAAYLLAEFTFQPIRLSIERQRRFIANVSHELRTPLTVIRTALDVSLRKGDALSRQDAIQVIRNSLAEVDRVADIIAFLLVFADFENRRRSFQMKLLDLSLVAGHCAGLLRLEAEDRNVTLLCEATSGCMVSGNRTALEEMTLNLLRNALEHTEAGGTVTVRVEAQPNGLTRLSVSDTGVGIAPQDMRRIFDPYYRGATGPANGMGLGLNIAQGIAHLHGSRIGVSSREGEGSVFSCDLRTAAEST